MLLRYEYPQYQVKEKENGANVNRITLKLNLRLTVRGTKSITVRLVCYTFIFAVLGAYKKIMNELVYRYVSTHPISFILFNGTLYLFIFWV